VQIERTEHENALLKQNVAFFEETGLCLLYEKYRPAA
jgi:hypothetical protein